MRSGKSRHKLLAVEFLSNISLDGTRHPAEFKFAESDVSKAANGTKCLFHSVKHNQAASCSIQAFRSEPTKPIYFASHASSDSSFRVESDHENGFVQVEKNYLPNKSLRPCELATWSNVRRSSFNHVPPVFKDTETSTLPVDAVSLDQLPTNYRSVFDGADEFYEKPELKTSLKWAARVSKELLGKRLNLCLPQCSDSPLTVFTINPSKRNASDTPHRYTNRPLGKTAAISPEAHVGCPASTSSSSFGVVLLGANEVEPISYRRPTGDTVHSCASLLHTFRSKNMPIRVYIPHSTSVSESHSQVLSDSNLIGLIQSLSSGGRTSDAAPPSTINPESHKLSFSNGARTNPVTAQLRAQTTPTSVLTNASSPVGGVTVARTYIDPLVFYSPNLLDDPDLLVVIGKRVFPLPNYLTSVLTYVRPTEQKRNVNREFHERFPMIPLTLTKLRSIKSVLVQIVVKLSFDLWIAAHAHVLFEKLVLKLLVNKTNRRACASTALLISAKLHDIKGQDLDALFQELETAFRISRRDILSVEIDMCLGLEFCLIPPEFEINPHFIRIHRALDIPPPYLLQYINHPVT